MFFHMDSIKEFKKYIQSWKFTTIAIIIIGVRGVGDRRPLWNGFNQECDNNDKKGSIFKGTTLHNFNKGCG